MDEQEHRPAIYPQELTVFDESSSDEEEMDAEGVRVTVMLEACGLGGPPGVHNSKRQMGL